MGILLLLALAAVPPGVNASTARADLKGLYDEISSVAIAGMSPQDVAAFREVIYAPGWTFVDDRGQRRSWEETRGACLEPSGAPPDFMEQTIRKLTLTPDGATVTVALTTLGEHGAPDAARASKPSLDRTLFRDVWIRVGDVWKMKSREQLGATRQGVRDPDRTGR